MKKIGLLLFVVMIAGCLGTSSDSGDDSNDSSLVDDASDVSDSSASGAGLSLFPNDFKARAVGSPILPKP